MEKEQLEQKLNPNGQEQVANNQEENSHEQ
jgi:hypothetical protein